MDARLGQAEWTPAAAMKPVIVTPRAYDDVRRLERWLLDKDANAAQRVGPLLLEAMMSLSTFPERGVQALRRRGRELFIPFGANGYVIRYRVEPTQVLIARVFHSRERR